jgi:hypothetical protein
VLTAHNIARVPAGGSLSERFREPLPLTTPLVKDLYWGCGAALNHIELLTGQAAGTVRKFMQHAGIPLRSAGGRSPFMRRWHSGLGESPAERPPGQPTQRPSHDDSHAERAARSKKEMLSDDIGCN